ncbi:MAG TPA: ArsB/NhaD family transporter [Candidatus Limnocylindria bacterium]|nr:ArsB/NhaD family transporter [Candidatus Limnocylindria bacterium]
MPAQVLAAAIFLLTFALIASERVNRVLAALLGASLVLVSGVLPQDEAFGFIDFNVVFLLVGTMTIASVLAKTGIFQWLGVEAIRRTRGDPYRLLLVVSALTAVLSAFVNNATTLVLLAPVTFYAADRLRVSPVPFLVSQVLASNIGGAATLIGDPPNLLIGSAFGIGFAGFVTNALLPSAIALAAYLVQTRWLFARELRGVHGALPPAEIERLVREERRVARPRLLVVSVAVASLVLVAFTVSDPLGLREATIALAGATILLIATRESLHEHLESVEWPLLLFFVGLFIVVGAVVKVGLVAHAAEALSTAIGGRNDVGRLIVLWSSGLFSAVIDNIPYTVAMIPLVREIGHTTDPAPLIWALAFGANFGGNATIIGGAANVVAAGLSEARGHPITFRRWVGYGVPATALSLVVTSAYIWLRYAVVR